MLGKELLEHLLYDRLGYADVEVSQNVYSVNITFEEAVEVVRRLQSAAAPRGKTVGVKFGNTLEVMNKGKFLKDKVMYLSGQPLHILNLALVDEWRKAFGPDFPISFSAGVDANNAADCVSTGMVPVTSCTDLLRPGGYARLPRYLANLERSMRAVGARSIPEFICFSARDSGNGDGLDIQAAILRNTSATVRRTTGGLPARSAAAFICGTASTATSVFLSAQMTRISTSRSIRLKFITIISRL
jgi:putative selenate reductase